MKRHKNASWFTWERNKETYGTESRCNHCGSVVGSIGEPDFCSSSEHQQIINKKNERHEVSK